MMFRNNALIRPPLKTSRPLSSLRASLGGECGAPVGSPQWIPDSSFARRVFSSSSATSFRDDNWVDVFYAWAKKWFLGGSIIYFSLILGSATTWGVTRLKSAAPPQKIELSSDEVEYQPQKNICTAIGNAVATQGQKILKAHRLIAQFSSAPKPSKEGASTLLPSSLPSTALSSLQAEGNVIFQDPEEELLIKADKITYDIGKEFLELKGNVKITRGTNQLNGEYGTMDLKSGVFKIKGQTGGNRVAALINTLSQKKN